MVQKKQLLWVLGLILGLGFLSISILGFFAAQASVRSSIQTQSLPLAGDSVYSEVQRQLLRPIFISAQMAENTFLRDWVLSGENNPQSVIRYLANIKKQFNANTSFFISERSKKYYYAGGILKTLAKTDPRDDWYFRFTAQKARYELSSDTDQANRNQLTIFINYRLLDASGRLLGVTGVGVTFDSLNKLISRIEDRFSQRVYFVSNQGNLMLADKQHFGVKDIRQISIKDLEGLGTVAAQILSNKNAKQTSFTRQGATVQLNSRYISELGWYLLIEQDESSATAPFLRLLLLNLLFGIIATALVLGLTVLAINQYQRRLEFFATTDALTGANNRSIGEALLEQAEKESKREQKALSLIIFDIDDFKKINDTYGHSAGDTVLREVVSLSKTVLRNSDTMIRWGGEEFLMLLKNCPLENAVKLASELNQIIAAHPFVIETKNIRVTVSVGVAQLEAQENLTQLIKRTDDAQYHAKKNGKNRVTEAKLAQLRLL
jgi:diguanylate cyclase (GGDEF)-like protein